MKELDFLQTSKRWKKYGEEYIKEGCSIMIFTVEKFLLSSIFIIGFAGTFIQICGIDNIEKTERIAIFLAIIVNVMSIMFATWSAIEMNKFMNRVGRDYENMSNKLSRYILDTGKNTGEEYPEYLWSGNKLKTDYLSWQHILQIILFLLGVILIVIFISLELF